MTNCNSNRRTAAFSLIEMMIAIVILGLGLIMVATMFPVAWNRASRFTEFTTRVSLTDAGEVMVRSLLQVNLDDPAKGEPGSFAGDLTVCERKNPADGHHVLYADTRVHPLEMENLRVSPRGYYPPSDHPKSHASPGWKLSRIESTVPPAEVVDCPSFFQRMFGVPQVRVENRLFPPLPLLDSNAIDKSGKFLDTTALSGGGRRRVEYWEDLLDTRRYVLGLFHRLRECVDPDPDDDDPCPPPSLLQARSDIRQPRTFDVYYVTLRRTQPTHRYAQQDPAAVPAPAHHAPPSPYNPVPPGDIVVPRPLGPDEDLLLPVPWRVQIEFLFASPADSFRPPPGSAEVRLTPSEVKVAIGGPAGAPYLFDLFQPGTPMIDEINGQVYRVTDRRIEGSTGDTLVLTLDRRVFWRYEKFSTTGTWSEPEDLSVHNPFKTDAFDPTDTVITAGERVRAVWLYPPPIVREGTTFSFLGNQPVVAIDVRPLTLPPRESH